MTFVLSEITHVGIIMASDSSETWKDNSGRQIFHEVDKTLYFEELNIGISTWGYAQVGVQGINQWLKEAVHDFVKHRKYIHILAEFTSFLSRRLDIAFGFDGNALNSSIHMGLHIAGYNSASEATPPGICHVLIEPDFRRFDPQMTLLALPKNAPAYHLRNGMYEEFAIMWPALSGIDASFRRFIASRYGHIVETPKDPIAVRAEWLGNWVKQMCLVMKTAGLPEYIGKTVKVLTFNHEGNVRWFHLPVMQELAVQK